MRDAVQIIKNFLKSVRRFVLGIKTILANFGKVYSFVNDPVLSQTYYPDDEHKSKLRIYFENLWWLVRFKEINEFYFVYGFDRKRNVGPEKYFDYSGFRKIRTRANACARVAFREVDYRCLLSDKLAFAMYLKALNFETPEVVAVCDCKRIDWIESHTTEPFESITRHGELDCFLKDMTGQCGQGVHHVEIKDDSILLNGTKIELEDLSKIVKGKWLLQRRLVQHRKMAELYPNSVNTIRLVTTYNGEVKPFSALLRIGAKGNRCDNWAMGGLLGGIDLETGAVTKEFVFKPGYGGAVKMHPETGAVFENFKVPYFKEAFNEAIRLHRFFYGVHSIGWDIAITNKGPSFIEGNDNWEISMHQSLEGGLKSKFLATLENANAE